jgi:predicted hydrolase (HD superfamily)
VTHLETDESLWVDRRRLLLVSAARGLAFRLLDGNRERIRHSAGVAARAATLTSAVGQDEASLLVAAAWLHDIGYSAGLKDTDFHPLDGARFLRAAGWDSTLCDLVAHHSGSRFVAAVRGLGEELSEFTFQEDPVSDALTVADQTIGPNGRLLSMDERMREMLERHGPDSANARVHPQREVYFRSAFERVTRRLQTVGITYS